MARPHYIASDMHLGAVPDETEHRFVRFLEHVGATGSALLLGGDVFDFWFEYGEVIPGRHFRVLAALAKLTDAGIPVVMVGGNHDAWGGRFLREEVGVAFETGLLRMQIAGYPALVAHGDGLGRGDFRYRALKAVLRSSVVVGAFRALHPELGLRVARAVSRTETRSDDDVTLGRARFLSSWAADRLREDPALRFVVCGHAHLPALEEIETGRYYLNAGDWIRHFTYFTVGEDGVPALERWES